MMGFTGDSHRQEATTNIKFRDTQGFQGQPSPLCREQQ